MYLVLQTVRLKIGDVGNTSMYYHFLSDEIVTWDVDLKISVCLPQPFFSKGWLDMFYTRAGEDLLARGSSNIMIYVSSYYILDKQ